MGNGQVTLEGTSVEPGTPASGGRAVSSVGGSGRDANALPAACVRVVAGRCIGLVPRPTDPVSATATPAITLRDIAAFRPAPGRQQMEPNGWVVPGLDANVYAISAPQLVPGTLFGQPATVRFTPVAYRWDYGDGAAVTRSTAGGTWAQLGLRDFDPTPTSHVYARDGEYVIRLSIDYRAEYRLGAAPFTRIAGTISLPANDLHVTATGAKTVLVEHDCAADPHGPGC